MSSHSRTPEIRIKDGKIMDSPKTIRDKIERALNEFVIDIRGIENVTLAPIDKDSYLLVVFSETYPGGFGLKVDRSVKRLYQEFVESAITQGGKV